MSIASSQIFPSSPMQPSKSMQTMPSSFVRTKPKPSYFSGSKALRAVSKSVQSFGFVGLALKPSVRYGTLVWAPSRISSLQRIQRRSSLSVLGIFASVLSLGIIVLCFEFMIFKAVVVKHDGFLFSAIRKSKTHSNISLLLKPRKDSQGFMLLPCL